MPPATPAVHPLTDPAALATLALEATAEGHPMVARLLAEWATGQNRFHRTGERAYIATLDGTIRAVCGLNIDPFANDPAIGRVRRLYVSPALRRQRIASALIQQLIHDATRHFHHLHLRTHDPHAAAFYLAAGFTPVTSIEHCTHQRSLIA